MSPLVVAAIPTQKIKTHKNLFQSGMLTQVPTGKRRLLHILFVAYLVTLARVVANAQSDFEKGFVPFQSYDGTDFDSVNLANGNLVLHIPLVAYPQRGGVHPIEISILANGRGSKFGSPFITISPGLTLKFQKFKVDRSNGSLQQVECITDVVVTDTSGASHYLGENSETTTTGNACPGVTVPVEAIDGSGIRYDPSNGLLDRSQVYSGPNPILAGDHNGNAVTLNGSEIIVSPPTGANGWIDTIGRNIPRVIPPTQDDGFGNQVPAPGCVTTNYPGQNGGTVPLTFCYANYTLSPSNTVVVFLQSVTLPNGTSWTLDYTSSGDVASIILPTGATVSYTYTNRQPCDFGPQTGGVTSRTLDLHDGNPVKIFKYSMSGNITTATDPDGNDTVHTFTAIGGAPCSLYETKTQYYQGASSSGGTLLKTVETQYSDGGPSPFYGQKSFNGPPAVDYGIFPILRKTTLPNGQVAQETYQYDNAGMSSVVGGTSFPVSNGNLLQKNEYDYGNGAPGPLVRQTLYQYQWQGNGNYQAANLLDTPCIVTVYGPGAMPQPSGCTPPPVQANQLSQVIYGYDENNGSPQGVHGNQTSVTHWLNGGVSPTSQTVYNSQGMPAQKIDPNGNPTTFTYDPTGLFPSQIQGPDTSGVHHIDKFAYDANTGQLMSHTDQNLQVTSYGYDNMRRPTGVTYPTGGGSDAYTYNDSTPSPSFTFTKAITSSLNFVETGTADGLGRPVMAQTTVPPSTCSSGTVTVKTTYDNLGRKATVSNPYCTTSDPTYGLTTYRYDPQSRVTQITKQDGSIGTVVYDQTSSNSANATCTTSTDEAGSPRKTCSDGLGRLIEVDEPGDPFSGTAASGGLTISGTLQSKPGTSGTPGTASITISGSEQSKSGVGASPGSPGTGSVAIGGPGLQSTNDGNGTVYDSGNLWITINGNDQESISYQGPYVGCDSTIYNTTGGYDFGTTAAILEQCINKYSPYVTATLNGSTINLQAKSNGSNTNYSLSAGSSYDTVNFSQPSFVLSPSGPNLTGGTNSNPGTTVYDSGTCTVSINGTPYSVSFGQGATTSSTATALASTINSGSWVSASASGATITLTAKTNGTATNYSLSGGNCSYNTSYFTSASFAASPSGSTLTGGTDGTQAVTDAGTVQMSVGGYSATANYGNGTGQDSTAAAVASDLASKLTSQNPPFTISASGAGININWSSVGTAGNVAVTTTSTTTQTAYFSTPSFASCSITANPQNCSTTLSGGQDPYSSGIAHPFQTLYTYDPLGNLTCVEQHGDAATGTGCSASPSSDATSAWRVRRFTYDSLSRLLTAKNPESGTIVYGYDADGNLLQKTSPAPNQTGSATQTLSYCYDALNRVTGKAYSAQTCTNGQLPSGTAVVSYSYDSGANNIGRLTSLTDPAGSGSYNYDNMGRIASESRIIAGKSKSMSYTYNLDGSVETLTYPSTAVVTYSVDSAGRDISAIDTGNAINYATGASYGPDGGLTGFVSGNTGSFAGITNSFSYNKRLQPINMAASSPSQTVFSIGYDFHLGNSNNGNVWGITNNKDTTRNQTFTYDALNRLTSAQNAGTDCSLKTLNTNQTKFWGNSYGYDAWGNLLSKTVTKCSAETLSVTALANNQLLGYSYDAAGNMTHDATSGLNYSYDQENRITGAAGFTYSYDGDGNRVEKSNGSTGTLYWYMTPGIVAESDLNGNLQSEYVFFDGERIARKDFPSNAVSYYFSDHLKTASVITDPAGNIQSESDYYPWGGELPFLANDSNRYKFTGKERDNETQLDYFGARYYSNGLGRFITPDWASKPAAVPYAVLGDPQSLNLYGYVRDIPTTNTDPDGHCWKGFQHMCNWIKYQVWSDDKHLNDALQKKAQADLKQMREWKIVFVDEKGQIKSSDQYFMGKSNQEIVDGFAEVEYGRQNFQADLPLPVGLSLETHHLLPRQFKQQFEASGLDIEDYTYNLPKSDHRLNPDGLHTGAGRGGDWNQAWRDFFAKYQNPTKEQILQQLDSMMRQFGLK